METPELISIVLKSYARIVGPAPIGGTLPESNRPPKSHKPPSTRYVPSFVLNCTDVVGFKIPNVPRLAIGAAIASSGMIHVATATASNTLPNRKGRNICTPCRGG
jgi:hypothetical protein